MVKSVASRLIQVSIYPSQEEFRGATDKYMAEVHLEFLKKLKKSQWIVYYEKNIYQLVSYYVIMFVNLVYIIFI